jgi:desampylase
MTCAPGVLEIIEAHARQTAPHECCGLLVGSEGRIDEAVPLVNRDPEPSRRYQIDPADFLQLVKRCRGTPQSVVGAYHSHPHSAAEPSPSDRAEAFADFVYVIAGPVQGTGPVPVRAFRLEDGNFRRVRLVPVAQEPET